MFHSHGSPRGWFTRQRAPGNQPQQKIFLGKDAPSHRFRERPSSFYHLSYISTPSWLLRSTFGFIQLCKLWENKSSVFIAWRQETWRGLVVQIEKTAFSPGREESSHPNMTTLKEQKNKDIYFISITHYISQTALTGLQRQKTMFELVE